jgi:murein DD-endopeptidase MepM/ murein hydrolase activator NlpD
MRRPSLAVVLLSLGLVTVSSTAHATSQSSDPKDNKTSFSYVFPFSKVPVTYPRDHIDYPATDIEGCYAHVLAPTSGIVIDTETKDNWDEKLNLAGTRGGLTVTIHGDDRVRYYFAHLGRVKVEIGDRLEPGQWIGVMGSSGNARVTRCHTHFGISRICPQGEYKVLQGEIWPWRFLDAWRSGINKSPVSAKNRVIKQSPAACELAATQS